MKKSGVIGVSLAVIILLALLLSLLMCSWVDDQAGKDKPKPTPDPSPYPGSIYVSNKGSDDDSGSSDEPVASISKGIELAVGSGKNSVRVASGVFVFKDPIEFVDGIPFMGGCDPLAGWEQDFENPSELIFLTAVCVRAENIVSETVISNLNIEGNYYDITEQSSSSVALTITDSTDALIIEYCTILSGNGTDGVPGDDGTDGAFIDNANGGNGGATVGNQWIPAKGEDGISGTPGDGGSGGGRAGGISYCIYRSNSPDAVLTNNEYTVGSGGFGGESDGANGGIDGSAGEVF
jgi:hypothetical protein